MSIWRIVSGDGNWMNVIGDMSRVTRATRVIRMIREHGWGRVSKARHRETIKDRMRVGMTNGVT